MRWSWLDPRVEAGAKRWLILFVSAYALFSFTLSEMRYLELQSTAWDLGLYQQALWSTAHGLPFFEAGDWEVLGAGSLLEVHSALVLYPLGELYGAFPHAEILFAAQSIVVAGAAIPLYAVGRSLKMGTGTALLLSGLYLVWTPILSSNLFDFHVEAFLPLEIFAFYWCWLEFRFVLGISVALLSFLTMEVAPILVSTLMLFFLLPPLWRTVKIGWAWAAARGSADRRKAGREFLSIWRSPLREPRGRWSLFLLSLSIITFFVLRWIQVALLPSWLGEPPPSLPEGFLGGTNVAILSLSSTNLANLVPRVEYWVFVVGLLGGLPLLAPRLAVLAGLPWVILTFASSSSPLTELGFQYGFIWAIPLLLATAYGLRNLPDLLSAEKRRSRAHPVRSFIRAALVGIVVLNLLLSPADPWIQELNSPYPGYRLGYSLSGGFSEVQSLAALVPHSSTVLATDDLFPLVANDVHAYVFNFSKFGGYNLPFNLTNPPEFLFLSQTRLHSEVPGWVALLMFSPSLFGLRGVAFGTAFGAVMLYQWGYNGPPEVQGEMPPPVLALGASTLDIGPMGERTPDSAAMGGVAIESYQGTSGTLWFGPYATLLPGNYTLVLHLRSWAWNPRSSAPPSTPTLYIDSSGFGGPTFVADQVPFEQYGRNGYLNLTFNFTMLALTTEWEMRGYVLSPTVGIELFGGDLTRDVGTGR